MNGLCVNCWGMRLCFGQAFVQVLAKYKFS